jgi:MerR family transcriptional regulator, light-induced transcriptional regulator
VSLFAAEVVARLVARQGKMDSEAREAILEKLRSAVLSDEPEALLKLRPELRRARVSAIDLADDCIPEVARRLGCDWVEDRLSFASVSIGTARLQGLLRDIGQKWSGDQGQTQGTDTLLLIVPEGEQHTLGALVLAGQLRRRGVSVCLKIGPDSVSLRQLLRERVFCGALLSVACIEKVEACRRLVKELKDNTAGNLPVVLGGALFERLPELKVQTGADFVTNDMTLVFEALKLTASVGRQEIEYV